ncbi:hypothetical protein MNBD_GAMMA22-2741 [hydrothermal vent metagenome]|uniref:DUF2069 domain-containing protein n=1 Tax=hydrothermal vent metagenome TaxID=652676 RepID=A0A3B0ZVT9_9ZZZZ
MTFNALFYRKLTLVSYFGLVLLFLYWIGYFIISSPTPKYMLFTIAIGPLLFPLYGLLRAKPYTHAWCSFLALAYFIHATVEAYANEHTRYLALIETALSFGLFIGCIYFVKMNAREKAKKN